MKKAQLTLRLQPLAAKSSSFSSLVGSLTSSNSIIKLRKLSDDEFHQSNSKANEVYKSQFGRTSVISETLRTVVHEKRNTLTSSQVHDFSPGSDLNTVNFRKELSRDSADSQQLGRFEKGVHDHLSHETRQRRNIIIRKQKKNCDSNIPSPQHPQSQLERNPKHRTGIRVKDN